MKYKAKIISLAAVFVMICTVLSGCNFLGLDKPSSLEEYLDDNMVQKKLTMQVKAMNMLGDDTYDEVAIYVEQDTKLVYDFRFKENPELNYLFLSDTLQETMNAPEFSSQFDKSIQDVRSAVGDGSVTFIIRYREPGGSIIGEKEVGV